MSSEQPVVRERHAVPTHVNANIENIAGLQRELAQQVSRHHRAIESVTGVIGSPRTLYSVVAFVAGWILYNEVASRQGWPEFDAPPFFWLQGLIGLFAAVVTTMVLTVQNRQSREAERRAHLELQVNLLAEQKAAKIIALLEELRRDLPNVANRVDPLANAMAKQVDPRAVLDAMESSGETDAERGAHVDAVEQGDWDEPLGQD